MSLKFQICLESYALILYKLFRLKPRLTLHRVTVIILSTFQNKITRILACGNAASNHEVEKKKTYPKDMVSSYCGCEKSTLWSLHGCLLP